MRSCQAPPFLKIWLEAQSPPFPPSMQKGGCRLWKLKKQSLNGWYFLHHFLYRFSKFCKKLTLISLTNFSLEYYVIDVWTICICLVFSTWFCKYPKQFKLNKYKLVFKKICLYKKTFIHFKLSWVLSFIHKMGSFNVLSRKKSMIIKHIFIYTYIYIYIKRNLLLLLSDISELVHLLVVNWQRIWAHCTKPQVHKCYFDIIFKFWIFFIF